MKCRKYICIISSMEVLNSYLFPFRKLMTQLEKGNHTWLYFEAGILQKNILSVQFCPEQTRSRKKAQVAEAASTEQPITRGRHQLFSGQTDIFFGQTFYILNSIDNGSSPIITFLIHEAKLHIWKEET